MHFSGNRVELHLDGKRKCTWTLCASISRLLACPGGARDGGGIATGGFEHLLPAQRLGAEHVEPGGEGAVADGGVGDGADHGHELAQAAAALVDAGARGPPGLEERDELPQELRLHDLHARAREQHRSIALIRDFFAREKGEEQEPQKQARFEEGLLGSCVELVSALDSKKDRSYQTDAAWAYMSATCDTTVQDWSAVESTATTDRVSPASRTTELDRDTTLAYVLLWWNNGAILSRARPGVMTIGPLNLKKE